jgi:hypothetical protein
MNEEPRRPTARRLFGLLERPEMPILAVLFLSLGVGIGVFVFPPQWELSMRVLGGLALGLTALLSLFANRMIGGNDFD